MVWGRGGSGGSFLRRAGGAVAGNAVAGPAGAAIGASDRSGGGWYGKASRGDIGGAASDLGENFGFGNRKAREGQEKLAQSYQDQYDQTGQVHDRMYGAEQGYYNSLSKASDQYFKDTSKPYYDYLQRSEGLLNEANEQATDARKTYTGTIAPNLKNIMEDARKEASGAMTLAQAGDPNNAVHQAVRGMYDQQAQNEGRSGLADAGVLQSLGAQAFSNQAGAMGPMTGSQMQLLASVNQGQAAQAFANTQRRMQSLRDQGIAQGFIQSDRQYERGQGAKDRYRQSVHDIDAGEGSYLDKQGRLRQDRQGMSDNLFGTRVGREREKMGATTGLAGVRLGNSMNDATRDLSAMNTFYGNQQGLQAAEIQAQNAQQMGKLGAITGLLGAGGTVAGAMLGGPAGASAGGAAGNAMGGAVTGAAAAPVGAPQAGYGYYGQGVQARQNPYGYGQYA